MRKFTTGLILAIGLTVSGCAGVLDRISQGMSPVETGEMVNDERGFFVMESAYLGAIEAVDTALGQGLIEPGTPAAARVASCMDTAYAAILRARAIHDDLETGSLVGQLTEVYNAVADIQAIIRGSGATCTDSEE